MPNFYGEFILNFILKTRSSVFDIEIHVARNVRFHPDNSSIRFEIQ